jgi:hypothetical protein
MSESREDSVYLAKLAEQAERYEEMVENMKRVASSDQELTVEERNLLSVAYKNVIGARRASWRIVSSIEQKEESKGNDAQVTMIKGYREKIEAELAKICEDILEVRLPPPGRARWEAVMLTQAVQPYSRSSTSTSSPRPPRASPRSSTTRCASSAFLLPCRQPRDVAG